MMLSESQERMLLVAERGREQEVFAVFRKWGLDAVEIGRVTSDGMLRVLHHGRVAAEIPAARAGRRSARLSAPAWRVRRRAAAAELHVTLAAPGSDLTGNFRRLLAAPAIASKRWVFEQYDHMVRTNTLAVPGAADAAVVRLKGTRRALALSTDGNGRWCSLDPRAGAMHAVAEAARNVAAVGARPWAATNCLNFGNPEKPEVMWQFSEAIDGISEACRALAIPITGGNVSFYNDTLGKSIDPTPILGVLGLLEDASRARDHGLPRRRRRDRAARRPRRGRAARASPPSQRSPLREFSSSEYARTIARHRRRRAAGDRSRRRIAPDRSPGGPRRRRRCSPPRTTSATAASPSPSPNAASLAAASGDDLAARRALESNRPRSSPSSAKPARAP